VDTWLLMAKGNESAARILQRSQRYRSAMSRAYYAAFALATHCLLTAGATFGGRTSPPHRDLRGLVRAHLTAGWPAARADALDAALGALYRLRIDADYVDGWRPTNRQAKNALVLLESVLYALEPLK
jgi:hypothetical protein